jgi:hypothetical protein
MGDRQGAYRVLVVRPEGKRPFGRHKRRWENNIKNGYSRSKMGTHELGQERERWRALASAVMNLLVP